MPAAPSHKVQEGDIGKRSQRQHEILSFLRSGRSLSVAALATALGVSDETVRRELRTLEDQGAILREHGGARMATPTLEGPLAHRMERNAEAKLRIARSAARFVTDGSIVFIDSGTTSIFTARQLVERRSLTVITNSLQVASDLGGINNNRLFLAGGEMDNEYRAFSDQEAQRYVQGFTPHLAILSVGGIDVEHGLTDFHPGEAAMSRIAYATSKRVLLGADASKFGRCGLARTAGLDQVDILVTDQKLDDVYARAFAHAEVVIA